jgi:hypothetical protein
MVSCNHKKGYLLRSKSNGRERTQGTQKESETEIMISGFFFAFFCAQPEQLQKKAEGMFSFSL